MSLDNVKNIVLVLSGKGGVGKSSITTQLALSLSLAGHSVGILDVDLTGPSVPRLLGIEEAKVKQAPGGWLPVEVHRGHILPEAPENTFPSPGVGLSEGNGSGVGSTSSNGGNRAQAVDEVETKGSANLSSNGAFLNEHTSTSASTNAPHPSNSSPKDPSLHPIGPLHCMSLAFLLSNRTSAIIWRGPKKTAMVRQFLTSTLWPQLDYLLIDTPPGTSDEHISLAESLLTSATHHEGQVAGAVIVTTPQAVAVADVRKEINFCGKVGVKVIGVVENMSGYVCECCGVGTNLFSRGGGEIMAREFGVEFLGRVPLDGQWGRLVEEGRRPRYGVVKSNGKAAGASGASGALGVSGANGTEEAEEHKERDSANQANADDDDEDDDDIGEDGETESDQVREKEDPGLLVDKYRNCSLFPVFEDISRKVVRTVQNNSAVQIRT